MAAEIRAAYILEDKASSTLKKIEAQAKQTQKALESAGTSVDRHQQAHSKASDTFEQDLKTQRMIQGETSKVTAVKNDAVTIDWPITSGMFNPSCRNCWNSRIAGRPNVPL